jgi:hypothetical protein
MDLLDLEAQIISLQYLVTVSEKQRSHLDHTDVVAGTSLEKYTIRWTLLITTTHA